MACVSHFTVKLWDKLGNCTLRDDKHFSGIFRIVTLFSFNQNKTIQRNSYQSIVSYQFFSTRKATVIEYHCLLSFL